MDYVFPKNNENDFIKIANMLGIKELCFIYDKPQDISEFNSPKNLKSPLKSPLKITSAILCEGREVNKYRDKYITMMKAPQDAVELRKIFEQYRPHIVFGLESQHRGDFIHHRASGLNQVHSVLAEKNNITVAFSFNDILEANPWKRQQILGRMKQNLRFAKKFKFNVCLCSFAKKPWQLRSERTLKNFFGCM